MNPVTQGGVAFFQVPLFGAGTGLSHGFFTRNGGVSPEPYASLNVGPLSADAPENVRENLRRVASALGAAPSDLVSARQVHGNLVLRVDAENAARSIFASPSPLEGDALVTDCSGVWLGILTADCLPVLFFDPVKRVIGAAHAGWRGTHARVSSRTVSEMTGLYGSRPGDLVAAMGPAVGSCCYVVAADVARLFPGAMIGASGFLRPHGRDRWTLDLAALNRAQLLESGVAPERIHHVPHCTRCRSDLFFSVRAQGEPTGRQLALIGLTEPPPLRRAGALPG